MRLSPHCHALMGFAYVPPWAVNAGFVWGTRRTLIVDTGPTALAAATILGYAEVARPGNTILAVNTECHLDHIAGNDYLRRLGIDVLGHPSIQRNDLEYAADVAEYCASVGDSCRRAEGEGRIPFRGTRIANPNLPVNGEMTLDLGDVVAEVLLLPGHTPANLAVWIASEGVLFVGDTVVSDYRPNLESGKATEWLSALERIERLEPASLVPGHGRILRGREIGEETSRVRACLEEELRTLPSGR